MLLPKIRFWPENPVEQNWIRAFKSFLRGVAPQKSYYLKSGSGPKIPSKRIEFRPLNPFFGELRGCRTRSRTRSRTRWSYKVICIRVVQGRHDLQSYKVKYKVGRLPRGAKTFCKQPYMAGRINRPKLKTWNCFGKRVPRFKDGRWRNKLGDRRLHLWCFAKMVAKMLVKSMVSYKTCANVNKYVSKYGSNHRGTPVQPPSMNSIVFFTYLSDAAFTKCSPK